MCPVNIINHEFFVAISFCACFLGLILLWSDRSEKNSIEATEKVLFQMSFSYWLVYCISFGTQKAILPFTEALSTTLKLTAALSYFLTFSCILILPLHRIAIRQIDE
ncbi:MAG: hypothetical protein AAF378_17445 [Cyanobacteria bacterium P01_A01_bin.84]